MNRIRTFPLHEQLLRVALLPPDRSVPAWDSVKDTIDLDTLWDGDAIKLLPLVYRGLVRAGVEDPRLGRLKGVMRRAWYDNQLLFNRAATAFEALNARGVRTLALKGLPLALTCYPELGLRSMEDIDLLVDPSEAAPALDALRDAGWPPIADVDAPARRPLGEQPLHEVQCRSVEGYTIDLHWRLVPWVARDGSGQDDGLWSHAVPLDVGDQRLLTSGSDDLLLQVILHAFRSGWETVPRWVADLAFVVRTRPDLDWDRLVARTIAGHLTLPVGDALGYAASVFDVAIPAEVHAALARTPSTARERRAYRLATSEPRERHALVGDLATARIGWARWRANLTPIAEIRSAPAFVARRLTLDSPARIPAAVGQRALRNVRAAVTR